MSRLLKCWRVWPKGFEEYEVFTFAPSRGAAFAYVAREASGAGYSWGFADFRARRVPYLDGATLRVVSYPTTAEARLIQLADIANGG